MFGEWEEWMGEGVLGMFDKWVGWLIDISFNKIDNNLTIHNLDNYSKLWWSVYGRKVTRSNYSTTKMYWIRSNK